MEFIFWFLVVLQVLFAVGFLVLIGALIHFLVKRADK